MRILGVDPSLTSTGYALSGTTGQLAGTLPPGKRTGVQRLAYLRERVLMLAEGHDLVAIEGYSYGSHSSHAHEIGALGGVLRLALYDAGIPFVDVPPASLKAFAAGRGNATKPDMRMALFQRLGMDLRDDNEVDAIWLLAAALHHYGEPLCTMPEKNQAFLSKVAWPEVHCL